VVPRVRCEKVLLLVAGGGWRVAGTRGCTVGGNGGWRLGMVLQWCWLCSIKMVHLA
jgi:hypothetical protein